MGSGGAERVAALLCGLWQARGDQVNLMPTFSGRGECFYELHPGVELTYLADKVGGPGSGLRNQWRRLAALRRHIRASRPDVVVSFLSIVNVAALLASAGLKMPVVICERIDPFAMPTSALVRLACRMSYPFARVLVVQTRAVAEKYRAAGARLRRIEVIGNPLQPHLLAMASTRPARQRLRLLAAGRLAEQKQFDLLVEVFAQLAPEHPQWDLVILGEGPLRSDLQRQIASLGMAGRIRLPGVVGDIGNELAASDLFALSSRFEGFPNVLLEAMASGLACVAFDCPSGPRELSDEGRGARLVPPGDTGALRRELDALMGDAGLRESLGAAARSVVAGRFAPAAILALWDRAFLHAGVQP